MLNKSTVDGWTVDRSGARLWGNEEINERCAAGIDCCVLDDVRS